MKFKKVPISQIQYQYTSYSQNLYDSIVRIGFSFPIKVSFDGQYHCIDGHKRLSILHDILEQDPTYHRGSSVQVIIINDESVRSNDCWRGRNTH